MDLIRKLKEEIQKPAMPGGLDYHSKCLIVTSALTSKAEFGLLTEWLKWIIAKGTDEYKIYETLLQCYLFCGYPTAIEALFCFNEIRTVPLNDDFCKETRKEWTARGELLCKKVYGGNYERLRTNFCKISPELEKWMIEEGYGKVLSRKALSGRLRELCTVASLIVTGFKRQLHSHIQGALNLGCSVDQIKEVFELTGSIAGAAQLKDSLKLFEKITR